MTLILDTCRHTPNCRLYISITDLIVESEFPFLFIELALCRFKGIENILRTQSGVKAVDATTVNMSHATCQHLSCSV